MTEGKTQEQLKRQLNAALNFLSFCKIQKDVGVILKKLSKTISSKLSIRRISLAGIRAEEYDASDLINSLLKITTLESLNLKKSNITSENLLSLSPGLKLCGSLVYLNLSSNNIGNEGESIITEIVLAPSVFIEELKLSRCSISSVDNLCNALIEKKSIKSLDLCWNNISKGEIFGKLLRLTNIKYLNLWQNQIEVEAAKQIALALPHSNIENLILWGNQIKDEGANYFIDAFAALKAPLKINLSSNHFSSSVGIKLSNSILSAHVPIELQCWGNGFPRDVIDSIVSQFKDSANYYIAPFSIISQAHLL